MKRKVLDPAAQRLADRERIKRQALRALKRAKAIAARTGVDLSEWEGEFLGSVEMRVETFGRAFADPEKGGMGTAFSTLQARKLKEIAAKAQGKAQNTVRGEPKKPRGWGR